MRTAPVVLLLAMSIAACAASAAFRATAPAHAGAFACAIARAAEFGYAVQTAEQEVFFRAERRLPARRMRVVNRWDVLTVTVAEGQLSVVVDGLQQDLTNRSREREAIAPSRHAQEHARAILTACSSAEAKSTASVSYP